VATQHYADPKLAELPSAAADATQLEAVLADQAIGGFEVETLVDAAYATISQRIESFFREAASDDLLLLHLSCHGQKDLRGRLFFAASDTDLNYPTSSGISSGFVNELIQESRSKRIVLMLDCCYSGAFTKGNTRASTPRIDVREPFSGKGRIVITSSTSLQYSYEGELHSRQEADPALFTAAVIRGLRDGDADRDGDGHISVKELYDYVHDQVTLSRPDQTPTLSVDAVEGTIYLARNPRQGRHRERGRHGTAGSEDRDRYNALRPMVAGIVDPQLDVNTRIEFIDTLSSLARNDAEALAGLRTVTSHAELPVLFRIRCVYELIRLGDRELAATVLQELGSQDGALGLSRISQFTASSANYTSWWDAMEPDWELDHLTPSTSDEEIWGLLTAMLLDGAALGLPIRIRAVRELVSLGRPEQARWVLGGMLRRRHLDPEDEAVLRQESASLE
jgi:hypothetical protein